MSDLRSHRLMWLKALLLAVIGLMSGGLLLLETPTLRSAALLALCVWAFCRAYYFAFYVIQHYIDPQYRFSGLFDFLRHLLRGK